MLYIQLKCMHASMKLLQSQHNSEKTHQTFYIGLGVGVGLNLASCISVSPAVCELHMYYVHMLHV